MPVVVVALSIGSTSAGASQADCTGWNPPNDARARRAEAAQQAQLGKPFAERPCRSMLANTNGCPVTGNLGRRLASTSTAPDERGERHPSARAADRDDGVRRYRHPRESPLRRRSRPTSPSATTAVDAASGLRHRQDSLSRTPLNGVATSIDRSERVPRAKTATVNSSYGAAACRPASPDANGQPGSAAQAVDVRARDRADRRRAPPSSAAAAQATEATDSNGLASSSALRANGVRRAGSARRPAPTGARRATYTLDDYATTTRAPGSQLGAMTADGDGRAAATDSVYGTGRLDGAAAGRSKASRSPSRSLRATNGAAATFARRRNPGNGRSVDAERERDRSTAGRTTAPLVSFSVTATTTRGGGQPTTRYGTLPARRRRSSSPALPAASQPTVASALRRSRSRSRSPTATATASQGHASRSPHLRAVRLATSLSIVIEGRRLRTPSGHREPTNANGIAVAPRFNANQHVGRLFSSERRWKGSSAHWVIRFGQHAASMTGS